MVGALGEAMSAKAAAGAVVAKAGKKGAAAKKGAKKDEVAPEVRVGLLEGRLAEKEIEIERLEKELVRAGKDALRMAMMIMKAEQTMVLEEQQETYDKNKALTVCVGKAIGALMQMGELIAGLPPAVGDAVKEQMKRRGVEIPVDLDGLSRYVFDPEHVCMVCLQGFCMPVIMTAKEHAVFMELVDKVRGEIGDIAAGGFGLFAVLHAMRYSLVGMSSGMLARAGARADREEDVTPETEQMAVESVLRLARNMGYKFRDESGLRKKANAGTAALKLRRV